MNLVSSAYTLLRIGADMCRIPVWDTEEDGPGVTMWKHPKRKYKRSKYQIVIGYYKSKKRRLFTLAHELGHCTKMVRNKRGEIYLKPRRIPVGEIGANKEAMKILHEFNPKWPAQFAKFYNWANRNSKRRKKI